MRHRLGMYRLTASATACTMSLADMLRVTTRRETLIAARTSDPRGIHGGGEWSTFALRHDPCLFKSVGCLQYKSTTLLGVSPHTHPCRFSLPSHITHSLVCPFYIIY